MYCYRFNNILIFDFVMHKIWVICPYNVMVNGHTLFGHYSAIFWLMTMKFCMEYQERLLSIKWEKGLGPHNHQKVGSTVISKLFSEYCRPLQLSYKNKKVIVIRLKKQRNLIGSPILNFSHLNIIRDPQIHFIN